MPWPQSEASSSAEEEIELDLSYESVPPQDAGAVDAAYVKAGKLDMIPFDGTFNLMQEFETANPKAVKHGWWEAVRQGRVEGLHLLASPTEPQNNIASLAVDFRQIFSLPVGYLEAYAATLEKRWRLASTYLEHFS